VAELFGDLEPIRPAYREAPARLALMDEQGIDKCFLFPTLGVGMEEALAGDPEALCAAFRAFNRWLDEDWGFHRDERIFAAPYITLVDPAWAAEELEWVLARGARLVCLRPGPVAQPTGGRSPGDPVFDPFWARVNEAGITVTFHAGDAGISSYYETWGEGGDMQAFRFSPLRGLSGAERPIFDTVGALICHGVFARFPNVRIASIENGGGWVHGLLKALRKVSGQMPQHFAEDPTETFARHVWVAPYFEDDARALADAIGVEHVLLGSDFPHAEGLADPVRYLDELDGFSDAEVRRIMRDNALGLLEPGKAA
jgi:predicted TIM-barrel fold metal-dependent hydrolase